MIVVMKGSIGRRVESVEGWKMVMTRWWWDDDNEGWVWWIFFSLTTHQQVDSSVYLLLLSCADSQEDSDCWLRRLCFGRGSVGVNVSVWSPQCRVSDCAVCGSAAAAAARQTLPCLPPHSLENDQFPAFVLLFILQLVFTRCSIYFISHVHVTHPSYTWICILW